MVRRILEDLGRWVPEPAERGTPAQAPDWPQNAVIPLAYHAVPDIARHSMGSGLAISVFSVFVHHLAYGSVVKIQMRGDFAQGIACIAGGRGE